MSNSFPYTRYACPCSETTSNTPTSLLGKRLSQQHAAGVDDEDTFNSHDPRASFSLYPIDHLLFCDECNQMRCPKCWTEDIMFWYCPNCLFEVPSSGVKSDGNRCARHCYNCPQCAGNLSVTSVTTQPDNALLRPDSASSPDSYILQCNYCDWSSLDIGIRFNKPTKITEQLNKLWKARHTPSSEEQDESEGNQPSPHAPLHYDAAFANLTKFYKDQLNESSDAQNSFSNSPYSSPANLARIMSLYGGLSYNALKKSREKPQPMREAAGRPEGLSTFTADDVPGEAEILQRMHDFEATTSESQRLAAPTNFTARFTDELWPVATPLKIRRGKRCKGCRQFLARPEAKPGSFRYKIRLVSVNFIPRLSIRELNSTSPHQGAAFPLRPEPLKQVKLQPHQTQQYILTVRNPIFETVKVTLATPAITPGKVASRVTILCPSFTIGPAGDMWDEALSSSTSSAADDGSRQAAMASLTGSNDADRQPEAGKVWERSRNATSVILEVVPGSLASRPTIVVPNAGAEGVKAEEDDDILEIPMYIRAEWDAPRHDVAPVSAGSGREVERENKELAYWCVLGLGRIAYG